MAKVRSTYSELRPHGLMFHRLHHDGAQPEGQGSLPQSSFSAILSHVGVDRILSPQEWTERARLGSLRDGDLCLTFDDGLKGAKDVALPVMQSLGVKAFWFVHTCVHDGGVDVKELFSKIAVTLYGDFQAFTQAFEDATMAPSQVWTEPAFIEFRDDFKSRFSFYTDSDIRFRYLRDQHCGQDDLRRVLETLVARKGRSLADVMSGVWMSPDDIRELVSSGHVIGLHSHDHPGRMSALPIAEQFYQYDRNRNILEALTRSRITAMSHPLGSYRSETLSLLADMGVEIGFRSDMHPAREPYPTLEFPRADAINLVDQVLPSSSVDDTMSA